VRGHAAGAGIARLSTQQESAGGGSGQLQTRGMAMDMAVGTRCGCRGLLLACCAVAVSQASGRETLATSFPKLAHADDLIGRSGNDRTTTNAVLSIGLGVILNENIRLPVRGAQLHDSVSARPEVAIQARAWAENRWPHSSPHTGAAAHQLPATALQAQPYVAAPSFPASRCPANTSRPSAALWCGRGTISR
jgi:hypothetical protein